MSGMALDAVLERYWGFHAFRPLQREAMDAVLDGRDALVVLPTGGGKSLCFQAPVLAMDGPALALVVSPLIALMKDQVDGLVASGVPAACLHSGQTADERAAAQRAIRSGECRLLYVSPERLVGEGGDAFRAQLAARGVRYVAVDEAHCISQWGHDFRREYRDLARLRQAFPGVSLHAFTATATGRVRRDIVSQLGLQDPLVLVGSFDRPNLTYRVRPRSELKAQILEVVRRHPGEGGIIYCLSRREVDATAAWLQEQGLRALPYHAGLDDATRARHQDAFINETVEIVVATVAFGMGIDRSNVRFVLHAGAPQSLEHYQQESGRAGRDGLPAECVLVTSPADFARWRSLLESRGEFSESVRVLLRDMERYAAATSCRHRALLEYFGQQHGQPSCGACDWCLGELEPVADPLPLAQKILSCVARVGQRWGVGHVTGVLLGQASEAIAARGHDRLSTFGLLKGMPAAEVRAYIDQLTQGGFLARTGEPYPILQLTEEGVGLLKGRGECVLYRQPRVPKGRGRRGGLTHPAGDVDQALFERLREMRLELARARGVPPYVVFHDSTLRELAARRPRSREALLDVTGIGQSKADRFGDAILAVLREAPGA